MKELYEPGSSSDFKVPCVAHLYGMNYIEHATADLQLTDIPNNELN